MFTHETDLRYYLRHYKDPVSCRHREMTRMRKTGKTKKDGETRGQKEMMRMRKAGGKNVKTEGASPEVRKIKQY